MDGVFTHKDIRSYAQRHSNNLAPLVKNLFDVKSKQELTDAFQDICNFYMIENFSIISIESYNKYQAEFSMFGCYPNKWITHYKEKQYYLIDPVIQTVEEQKIPFSWDVGKFNILTHEQSKFLNKARENGIKCGTTIPLLSVKGLKNYLTVLNLNSLNFEEYCSLSYAAVFFLDFMKKLEFVPSSTIFTPKELSVIKMKSKGFATKQVSYELGLSDATVIFHLKNIRRKMNTKNMEQALYEIGCAMGKL